MAKYEVHISDVRAFKTCRRQWQWSSPLGKNLEPDKPYAPFFLGRIVHTALELHYRSNDQLSLSDACEVALTIEREKMEAAGTLWDEEKEMLDEQSQFARGLIDHYFVWVNSKGHNASEWGDMNLEYLDMETNFVVPLLTEENNPSNRVELGGRFDGIVRRRDDGSLWLFETKTTRSIAELQKTLAWDEQAGGYIYAAQLLMGEQVHGVIYNILRKKLPTEPRVLVNGQLTQQSNIDTTLEHYWRAVLENHPDEERETLVRMYGDVLQTLYEKGNTFFSRTVIRRTPREIEELANNLRVVALEMVRPSTPLYPAPSWTNCTFCRFRGPCLAMNSGADYDLLLDNEYRQRKDREFRPFLLYGFHFVPIANDSVSVWYYGDRIVEDAPGLTQALADAAIWITEQDGSPYMGPSAADLLRGAREVGLWQAE